MVNSRILKVHVCCRFAKNAKRTHISLVVTSCGCIKYRQCIYSRTQALAHVFTIQGNVFMSVFLGYRMLFVFLGY